ncbi:1747_t:CDS:2 [Racocetra persica]|uniref:1747_t:CDS:1 n=1 Tax=Racocetra persica TaxID=160502 RepID=A0ACA9LSR1_9GLOM|nr:1747_t:CDS:2 [Racocetra persica]
MEKIVGSTPTVISDVIEVTEGLTQFTAGSDAAKNALCAVGAVGEAVKPFVPLISAVTLLISEIIVIYENAQYNKRICNSLMDRVGAAEQAIKSLQRRKAENEKRFKNAEYYKNFVRFVDVLKRIKGFIKDVSELQGYKKFFHSGSIKEKFDSLVKEFETVMGDLHFTMAVADEEQRRLDHEALEQDISDMTKVNLPNSGSIKAVEINSDELLDPDIKSETDRRGKKPNYIYKKTYKVQEVACKQINIPSDDDAKATRKPLSSPALLPAKTLDLDGSMKKAPISVSDEGGTELPDLGDEFNIDAIEPVMPLEDGIIVKYSQNGFPT